MTLDDLTHSRLATSGQSVVEQKVRAKLHELDSMGLVLGAQVGFHAARHVWEIHWECQQIVEHLQVPLM